jgi:metallo-beta-lactamase class B
MILKQSPQSILFLPLLFLFYLLLPGCSGSAITLDNDASFKELNDMLKDKNVYIITQDSVYEGRDILVRPDSTFINSPHSAFSTKSISKIQPGKGSHKSSELVGLAVGAGFGALLGGALVAYLRGNNNIEPKPDFAPWTDYEGIGLGSLLGALVGGCVGALIGNQAGKWQDIVITSQLDENLSIEEIKTNVYLVTHRFPWASNSLVVKLKKGEYLLIDTPYTDEATEKVVKFLIGKDSSNLKITAVNTHFHNDRLGGNGYLKKIGAHIYGSDLTVKLLNERGLGNGTLDLLKDSTMKKYYDYWKDAKLTPPDSLFSLRKGLTLSFDNDTWEIYYPGPGHTQDNIVVYFPEQKILFAGCLIKSMESNSQGFIGDADLTNWSASAHNVFLKYPRARLVIPGHGKLGGRELIFHTMDLVK